MRVVIELKRGEVPEIVLNNLFKLTQLQDSFGMNMVALVDGQPRILNLKQFLEYFLIHRREVVVRRTALRAAQSTRTRPYPGRPGGGAVQRRRDHCADQGLADAARSQGCADGETVAFVDRRGNAPARGGQCCAPDGLPLEFGWSKEGYRLSDAQAQAILELRLQRLTGLEQEKITGEYREVMALIVDLLDILAKPRASPRSSVTNLPRSAISSAMPAAGNRRAGRGPVTEDLIAPADLVVTLSHGGYEVAAGGGISRAAPRRPRQAGDGHEGRRLHRPDVHRQHPRLHPVLLQPRSRLLAQGVQRAAGFARIARQAIVNLVPLVDNEKITAILPVKEFTEEQFVFMATAMGTVKKTPLSEFSRPRPSGIIAVDLTDGDSLIGVALTDGKHDVMLFSSGGKAVRFDENDVGRWAATRMACAA
jgi:DNA gyrase subunit A